MAVAQDFKLTNNHYINIDFINIFIPIAWGTKIASNRRIFSNLFLAGIRRCATDNLL